MKTAHIYSPGYALLAGLLLTASTGARAVDNNLHFYGNLLSKSCTLVVDGANLGRNPFSHRQQPGFDSRRTVCASAGCV